MGFFSKFERRVEDGFEGMGDKLFDAPISPVQIAKKAEKQMRREKMVGAGKEFAPTLYTVLVNPDDDERLFGYYPTLAGETETYLRAKAQEAGLAMDGDPLVRFIIDDDLKHGKFDVVAELVSSAIIEQLRAEEMARYGLQDQPNIDAAQDYNQSYQPNPAQQNYAPQPAAPVPPIAPPAPAAGYASSGIDVMVDNPVVGEAAIPQTSRFDNYPSSQAAETVVTRRAPQQPRLIDLTTNRSFPLMQDRVLLGRALSSNIAIEDLTVSRTHAEIRHQGASAWSIADLGSANGTLVNGRHIASVMLQEGDRITVGTTTFLYTFQ